MEYEYIHKEKRRLHIEPCPKCLKEDIDLHNMDGGDDDSSSFGKVKCKNCGHTVLYSAVSTVSGNECQLHAIEKWNTEYRHRFSPNISPEVYENLVNRVKELEREKSLLILGIEMAKADSEDGSFAAINEIQRIVREYKEKKGEK